MFPLSGKSARRDEPLSARTVYADGGTYRLQALDYVWNELSWRENRPDARLQPFVLDLGAPLQRSLSFLTGITSKIHYEDLPYEYALGGPRMMCEAFADHVKRLRSINPTPVYDLVLCWDVLNYLPPEDFRSFAEDLMQVVGSGSFMHLLLSPIREIPKLPGRYQILDRTTVSIEFDRTAQRPSHHYNQLHLKEALPSARVCRSVLLRNGAHEHLVRFE